MTSKNLMLVLGIAVITLGTLNISANSKIKKEVTFNKDVAPIFFKNCVACHRPNDIAPFSLLSYKESRPWARSIKEKVLNREMPPWSPDPKYGEFSNDCRLNQQDIDTVVAWVDQGAKEGNAKELPPVPAFTDGGWQIGQPDLIVSMPQEQVINPKTADQILYFNVPTNLKEDKWVQAAEIHPGNKRVVHHVIAFVMSPDSLAKSGGQRSRLSDQMAQIFYRDGTLSRVKAEAPVVDDGCNAPKGVAVDNEDSNAEGGRGIFLAGYAPGRGIDVWRPGTAKRIPAGAVVVFQLHYSSFKGAFEQPEKDRTSVGLKFTKEAPKKEIKTEGISNFLFKIPAGASSHQVTSCRVFKQDVQVISYMPHMHLRGKDMKYEIVYPDGRKETLLWVPKFNFNWQTMYELKKPLFIPKGARMIITAHFDNSDKNKYNPDFKKDIRWGDPTYDEMMIGWMDYLVENPVKPDLAKGAGK